MPGLLRLMILLSEWDSCDVGLSEFEISRDDASGDLVARWRCIRLCGQGLGKSFTNRRWRCRSSQGVSFALEWKVVFLPTFCHEQLVGTLRVGFWLMGRLWFD